MSTPAPGPFGASEERRPSSMGGGAPVCPRHPDRPSYISCQRCGRPACAECQRSAPVGVQCVDCVRTASKAMPAQKAALGGRRFGALGDMPVTYTLIGLCVVLWGLQLAFPRLTVEGAFVPGLAEHQPWRFLTSAFLHDPSGPMHLMFNMFALWTVGGYLEKLLGQVRYLALYLVSGLGGSVGSLLLATPPNLAERSVGDWFSPSVGASGAVFGLFLALLIVDHSRGRSITPMLALIGVNLVIGFVYPNIEWQAHLGGAVTGAVLAWGLMRGSRQRSTTLVWSVVVVVAVLLVVAAVIRYALAPDLGIKL